MKKGWFITFEGPDGAGKTTQMTRLTAYLRERGLDVLVTREPGGTPIGEQIRHLLLDPGNSAMDPVTETLLYAASRAQHVREVIGPALAAGRVVVCDRFFDSSLAYQAYGRGLGERMVRDINGPAMGDIAPDATICMLARPETSRRRLSRKNNALDRLENEDADFFDRVYEGYLALARAYPGRILLLDADRSKEDNARAIREKIDALLAGAYRERI
jgi:dTMP kinase